MNKLFTILFTSITLISVGQELSEVRTLENFTKINAKGVGDIYLINGEQNIVVEAKSGSLKKLKTELEGNVLNIYEEKNSKLKNTKIYITSPDLNSVKLSGAGNIISKDTLHYNNLNLEIVGAGDVDLIVNSFNLKTNIRGAGDVKLRGKSIVHEIDVAGAGDLIASELQTEVTNARVAGAGDIHVNATEELNVNVSGAGDVFFENEPKKKNINISGAGDIFSLDDDSIFSPDTTKLKFGNHKLWIIGDDDIYMGCDTCDKESPFKHWAGFEIGANGYMSSSGLSMPAGHDFLELNYSKSINVNLHLIEKGIKIIDENKQIISGFGFEWNSYAFNNKSYSLQADSSYIYAIGDTVNNYSKNKLNTIWATVPLMVTYNTNSDKDNAFHFAAGVVGGYRIGTKYKQKYTYNNKEFKNNTKSNYNLLPYRLAARVSAGYGNFNIYATYSLTEFFEENKGPGLNAFTVGIRAIPF